MSKYKDSASLLLLYNKAIATPTSKEFEGQVSEKKLNKLIEEERAVEKILTIEELVDDFAKKNKNDFKSPSMANSIQ